MRNPVLARVVPKIGGETQTAAFRIYRRAARRVIDDLLVENRRARHAQPPRNPLLAWVAAWYADQRPYTQLEQRLRRLEKRRDG